MDEDVRHYNRRVWLNDEESSSTGSLVCFHGLTQWNRDTEPQLTMFIEVADCHDKIRLHNTANENRENFIQKLNLLVKELSMFLEFLNGDVMANENA